MKYSIIVPLCNEEDNIILLHKNIVDIFPQLSGEAEILFIDDGSTDNTVNRAKELAPLTLLVLQKNMGQTAAMDAGIREARGEYIITLDGDLQNDPSDIPRLIKYLETKNLDAVSGWRKDRKDPFFKRFVSRGAHFFRQILLKDGIHDSGCSLKVYRRECFETITLYGEMHRFIPALLQMKGFRIGELVVRHHPRQSGKTKYNWRRTIKGGLDMLSVWFWQKYANRPMHLLGSLGIFFFLLGTTALGITIWQGAFHGQDFSDNALFLVALFSFFSGLQLFLFGILFDITTKTYYEFGRDRVYLIREKIENKKIIVSENQSKGS